MCMLVEASTPIGRGDRFIADLVHQVATPKVLVVNKIDLTHRGAVAEHLAIAAAELGEFDAYVPLSARTGDGLFFISEKPGTPPLCEPLELDAFVAFVNALGPQVARRVSKLDVAFEKQLVKKNADG